MLLQLFVFLQVLDFATTLVGFRVGAGEASPFIRTLLHFGPAVGVALSKVVALGLAGICIWMKKDRILRLINCWYAGLVVWNVGVILIALGVLHQ